MGGCGSANAIDDQQRKHLQDLMGKTIPKMLTSEYAPKRTFRPGSSSANQVSGQAQNSARDVQRVVKKAVKFVGDTHVSHQDNVTVNQKRKISNDEAERVEQSLYNHFVFFNLSFEMMDSFVRKMVFCAQKAGEVLFQQGDQANAFYYIYKGKVEVIFNQQVVAVKKEHEYFGEIALLYNIPRSATIKTIEDCEFWMMDRPTFRKQIEEIQLAEFDENKRFIDQVLFFQFMTQNQRNAITHSVITTRYPIGHKIVKEGEGADSFYLIKTGKVQVWNNGRQINKLGPKDCFGEQALYQKSVRKATIVADTVVRCLVLTRDTLTNILGDQIQVVVFNNVLRWGFLSSPILSNLTQLAIEKMTVRSSIENVGDKTIFFQAGQKCNELIVILEGRMRIGETVFEKGFVFGDKYLRKQDDKEIPEEVRMVTEGVVAKIGFETLFKILATDDIEEAIAKKEDSHEIKIKAQTQRQACNIELEEIYFVNSFNHGVFGILQLVEAKGIKYVMKSVQKQGVFENQLEQKMSQIRKAHQQINFPFIRSLITTYQDHSYVHFLLEYIEGVSLFNVSCKLGLLNNEQTQYYVGSMLLILEYLHARKIILRDLKPENLLIDTTGRVVLIDLDSSRSLQSVREDRTYTIVGTPNYMAPEVLLGKGYSYLVDLWSLGVCCYELLFGQLPFREGENPFETYEEIVNSVLADMDQSQNTSISFPSFYEDELGMQFMTQLLSRYPEARLGSSYSALKAHLWFEDFDWDSLYNGKLPPPYIPKQETSIQANEEKVAVTTIFQNKHAPPDPSVRRKSKFQDWDKEF